MAAKVLNLDKKSSENILAYLKDIKVMMGDSYNFRENLEMIDRYYLREVNWESEAVKLRLLNSLGRKRTLQDIVVPVVMPQVESALAYMVNVYLTGYPVFGVVSDPKNQKAAKQLETVIAENAVTAGWARHLMMFFRDGFKYNLQAIECDWKTKMTYSVEADSTNARGTSPKEVLWQGNVMKRVDLYNAFFDPRVAPSELYSEGEFAGYVEVYSAIRLRKLLNDLGDSITDNTKNCALRATNGIVSPYYIPKLNPVALLDVSTSMETNWVSWLEAKEQSVSGLRMSSVYEVTTMYARIIPKLLGLAATDDSRPQVWKFMVVNDSVIIHAAALTNAHDYIPIFFGQPLEDGLTYQTKSFASNVTDMQDVASALWNGYLASKRRLVGDRVLFDPSRIREKDINSSNPAAKIPVRPVAYGTNIGEAVYQFPYHDERANSLIEGSDAVVRFANLINAQNPAQQGQFVKGNKTMREYEDVMGHGNSKNQTMAISTEAQVFVPLKNAIKLNIMQYQPPAALYNQQDKAVVQVTPGDIRSAVTEFKISDGLVPEEKLISADEFMIAFQVIGSSPQLSGAYELAPMATYLLGLRGADVSPFEKSPLKLAWEQQLGQWQQVAMEAVKTGQQPPPQPQMPAELQKELQMQQEQQGNGGTSNGQV